MPSGSNASKGGKGSGVVGFQRVTTGANHIPTPSTVPTPAQQEPSSAPTMGITPEVANAYNRLNGLKRALELNEYGVDENELTPRISDSTVREALTLLAEVRDNYRFGCYQPGARLQSSAETNTAGVNAYQMLGYSHDEARHKLSNLYVDTAWEGPDDPRDPD